MTIQRRTLCAIAVLALAACSDFSSGGTSMPGGGMVPPMQTENSPGPGRVASQYAVSAPRGAVSSATANDAVVLAFARAGSGLQCPQIQGYTCFLRFNAPKPAPSAKHKKATAAASPSPSPAPSPSPSSAASASPNPQATSAPQITLALQAAPKDAPALPNPDSKAPATAALLALRMHVSADVAINGAVSADFSLPPDQVAHRAFAIGLFQETVSGKKHRRDDRFFGSYSKSTLASNTLHFTIAPPSVAIKKDEVWLFVLYGDQRPDSTPAPAPAPSAGAVPAASPVPFATPALPVASPTASP